MLFLNKDDKEEVKDEKKIVDSIRCLALDMINEANSGHSGIALGAAPILYTLYAKHLKFNVDDPNWYNRDRFILSAGHGSALLYSTLYMAGFDISIDDLKNFRKTDSKVPGHPEFGVTPGVDMSTGPLGQGFASSVGMAIAEEYLRAYFNKNNSSLINYYTYVLCSDGDLMEGLSYEAASLAGTLKLNHLIALYDCNHVTLDGDSNKCFTDNIEARFSSMDWNTITVDDADDLTSLDNAIIKAKQSDKPTIIIVNSTIGKYSNYQGTNKAHGSVLSCEEISAIKEKLGIRNIPFAVSQDANVLMHELIDERKKLYEESKKEEEKLSEELKCDLDKLINNKQIILEDVEYEIPEENEEEIRLTNGKILSQYVKNYPFIMGGSADLNSSCKTYIDDCGDFTKDNRLGKNIFFGVREHAMGSIMNGLALSGFRTFCSTFLAFSDYMKPAIRMSAMMNLPVLYIFTNDSITIGEDGPSHQPVEQLVSLRAIPNTTVFRPFDVNEILGVYDYIFKNDSGPSIISIGKNKIKINEFTSIKDVCKGAYIVKKEEKNLSGIIISSGEELELALNVANKLNDKEYDIRVISMSSIEIFDKQDDNYKNLLLPLGTKVIVIEPSSSYSWNKFVYNDKYLITLDQFGSSCSKEEIIKKYNFDIDSVFDKIENLLK